MPHPSPALLIVSAIDPSGGAGMYLDLAVAKSLGVKAAGAATAITVQNASRLEGAEALSPKTIQRQIECLEEDFEFGVAKIGALGSAANARVLSRWAAHRRKKGEPVKLVLDPVRKPSRGKAALLSGSKREIHQAMERLLGETFLLTPNISEALWLAGRKAPPKNDVERIVLAKEVLDRGPQAVLLKGGHVAQKNRQITDLLLLKDGSVYYFAHPRRPGTFHGTGCFLSSAIAAILASGNPPLPEAVSKAIDLLDRAMKKSRSTGRSRIKQLG
ncbi:MAG: hydroxymethylpyrimidine/phosphomethylpyrimidine kinase [Bdellovibrionota bacterium]